MEAANAVAESEDVALLGGSHAGVFLERVVTGRGQRLLSWQLHSIHHRPGAGVTAGYSVRVRGQSGEATHYICLTTARLSAATPGLMTFDAAAPDRGDGAGGGAWEPSATSPPVYPALHAWYHPDDPELPALAAACTPSLLSERVGRAVRPQIVAYRPTRRAVVKVLQAGEGEQGEGQESVEHGVAGQVLGYVKVLKPRVAREYVERYELLRAAGLPVPAVLRCDADGFVMLENGSGHSLAVLISQGMSTVDAQVVFARLMGLLDALPARLLSVPARPAWADRVGHYAHAAATVLPSERARIEAVAQGVEELMDRTDPGPVVPVHGDFYEANVLMSGHEVTCILDVDSVGPGHRVDDVACLLGHASVLDHVAPVAYPKLEPIVRVWTQCADELPGVDPVALRARCAGVVLSLVAGARRHDGGPWQADALGRLARAETWLAQGREMEARRGPHGSS